MPPISVVRILAPGISAVECVGERFCEVEEHDGGDGRADHLLRFLQLFLLLAVDEGYAVVDDDEGGEDGEERLDPIEDLSDYLNETVAAAAVCASSREINACRKNGVCGFFEVDTHSHQGGWRKFCNDVDEAAHAKLMA